jgi:predicted RND superfamily exporter protein
MKTSAIKILQSYFNKKNINNLKKIVNAKKLAIGSIAFFIIIILAYLLRPIYFDYELEKQVLKNKIDIILLLSKTQSCSRRS